MCLVGAMDIMKNRAYCRATRVKYKKKFIGPNRVEL